MSEKPKNADIFFAGSKSGFNVKLRNKPYLHKHKKDQKYKSNHKHSKGHYINQCYKINNRRRSIEKKDKNNKRSKSERRDKSNYNKNAITVEDLTKTNDLLKYAGFILDKEVEVVFDIGASSSILRLNTAKTITSAYNPRTNGKTEIVNQTIVSALKKQSALDPENWNKYLPYVLTAYRTRKHSSTKFSPYEMFFGRKMNSIRSWEIKNGEDDESALIRWTAEIQKPKQEILQNAVQNLHKAQDKKENTQNKQKNLSYDF
ncbi:unnamed protein product [Brachionus calyciflorus]|uniref:Integrase catalytic domain-containing protein n=1 Tax=Brachionus calyciflorus TaxID=104777 RepID=A0A814HM05_9BILA|nr:unnamed protein product [Brachionus calyciflorus]